MNRRDFLKASAGAAAVAALGNYHVAGAADAKPYRVGLIGSGWYGKCDLFRLLQVAPCEVVSISDVDKKMLGEAADWISTRTKGNKKPRTYTDWRKQVAEKDLDIALIGTPDHWHALQAIEAMKAGADLYLQKPISVDVVEGQAILAAARKYKRVVQVGTQRRSTPHLIEAKDQVIKEGKLGRIGLVEIYCYYHMRLREKLPDIQPPEYLDFDAWTGPAPMRPFNRAIHPRGWRSFFEYGNGILGDMCIHMLDTVRWMMGLGWPTRIGSSGGILVHKESSSNVPDTQLATFDYPDTKVVWTHRTWGHAPDPKYPWGMTFYGEKGTLKASVMSYDYTPMDKGEQPVHKDVTYEFEQYPEDKTEKDLERHVAPAIRGHMKDLLNCIGTRGKPVADIEEGHISTASCILANLALQLGRTLAWDPARHQVIGDEEANTRLRRTYRQGYTHPEPDKV